MTLAEIRKRNAQRKQIMQSRSRGLFVKFVNDQDTMIVKLVPPFEGFDREVKTMQGEIKPRPHYRMHVIGDYNFNEEKSLTNPRLEFTVNDVRNLKDEDAKIWTTPYNAVLGIQREIEKGHSILQIRRDGVAKSTDTSYNVLNAMQIAEEDWQFLLPKLSKEELAKIQSEEKWNEISSAELEALENLGVRDE
jgi:predicted GNAT family acetyltransferase